MTVKNHIFLHMGTVHTHPFAVHAVDIHFPIPYVFGIAQNRADIVLRLPMFFKIRFLNQTMNPLDQVHKVLAFLMDALRLQSLQLRLLRS